MNNKNNSSLRTLSASLLALLIMLPLVGAAQTKAPLGILVSESQNTIDWPTVNEANDLEFVYVMATTGAAITFDNFQAAVRGHHLDLPPVVYVVPDSPFDINVKRLDMLLQLLEQAYGVKPMIMASQQAYLKYFSLERYASYHVLIVSNELKFPATRYTIWQYTDKEKVAGIKDYVPGLKLHPTYPLVKIKAQITGD